MLTCLFFSQQALSDLRYYVANCPGVNEITGIGRICKDGDGTPHVSEVRIYKQTVSPGLAKAEGQTIDEFLEDIPQEQWPEWSFQWHSHPTFGTDPSGTDTTDYAELQDTWGTTTVMIFNRKDEFWGGHYTAQPVAGSFAFTKIWPAELKRFWKRYEANVAPRSLASLKSFVELAKQIDPNFNFTLDVTPERAAYLTQEIRDKVIVGAAPVVTTNPYVNNGVGFNAQANRSSWPPRNANTQQLPLVRTPSYAAEEYFYGDAGIDDGYDDLYQQWQKEQNRSGHTKKNPGKQNVSMATDLASCNIMDNFLKAVTVNGTTYLEFENDASFKAFARQWESYNEDVKDVLVASGSYREALSVYGFEVPLDEHARKMNYMWSERDCEYKSNTVGRGNITLEDMVTDLTSVCFTDSDSLTLQILLTRNGIIEPTMNGMQLEMTPNNEKTNYLIDDEDFTTHLVFFDYWLSLNTVTVK